jgi:hypothetical protein
MYVNFPNLFLIGAPKCGTTALSKQLSEHPKIFLPKIKETRFFDANVYYDYKKDCAVKSINDYLKFYKADKAKYEYLMDAAIFAMYSMESIKKILRYSKNPKFILILRDPLEAAKSLHKQHLKFIDKNRREISENFYYCWDQIKNRKKNKSFPTQCRNKFLYRYDLIYSYEKYVPKLLKLIKSEKILIINYKKFKDNPNKIHKKILRFLELQQIKLPTNYENSDEPIENNCINFLILKISKKFSFIKKIYLFEKFYYFLKKYIFKTLIKSNYIYLNNELKNKIIKKYYSKSYAILNKYI